MKTYIVIETSNNTLVDLDLFTDADPDIDTMREVVTEHGELYGFTPRRFLVCGDKPLRWYLF